MNVVVVGAGPSGLLLSLMLGRAGIRVTLLDGADTIDDRPRAAHYAPCAIRELARAGVLDDIRSQGFIPGDMCWRKLDGSLIVQLNDSSQKSNPEALTVLHIADLLTVLVKHIHDTPNIQVKWKHTVTGVVQDANSVTAHIQLADGSHAEEKGDYLCGCDGGSSRVRKSLFGGSFEGFTWNAQLIATNVYYPMEKFGYSDINFIIHPEHYYMAARITRDGLWRVSYGVDTKLELPEIIANQPKKYEMMLPGNPKPEDYKLVSLYPYRIHQRCAEKFRVGRVCLAADAAHVCNPFGGLGITGGIVDVGGLADCLEGIHKGSAHPDILDNSNFLRVSSKDPDETARTDETIQLFRRANEDLVTKKQVDESFYGICHDFKQYYRHKA